MEILSIIGSSRRKSTLNAVKIFENELIDAGRNTFDYIFLNDFKLEFCRGCGLCVENENKCPINDDWMAIYERILKSDLVVFATPVYENHISALMKNFFDRFHFLGFRPLNKSINAIIIATCSFSGLRNTLKYMEWVIRSFGFKLIFKTGIQSYLINENKYIEILKEKIRNIEFGCKNPGLTDLLIFNDQKDRILKIRGKYHSVYQYWMHNGWLEKEYYHDIKINPVISLLARILKKSYNRN